MALRIGIVAAEASGDLLAEGLMAALRERYPQVHFEGIGGPRMQAQGLRSWEPMETLSVMGLVEVLRHLPRLLKLRKDLRRRWLADPPDLFIGVDAPDFNLGLETSLRKAGIPTVHYVCPTVWAWREGRVKHIRAAADLVLSIFPFEKDFLARHRVRSEYVGHTLAAEMPLDVDRAGARAHFGIDEKTPVLAVLPGSRVSEVSRLAQPFVQTALACQKELPNLQVLTPLVNERTASIWREQLSVLAPGLPVIEAMQDTSRALAAADVALVASGTATFEGLLSKRPMVVGYRLNTLTYWLVRIFKLLKLSHFAMANLLSKEPLAPEFMQNDCVPEKLAPAVLRFFRCADEVESIQSAYTKVHQELSVDTDTRAAEAVLRLLRDRDAIA
jgi:lipid-A-disaccharide synthase